MLPGLALLLLDLCLRYRPIVVLATLVAALVGLLSLSRLPFDAFSCHLMPLAAIRCRLVSFDAFSCL